MVRHAKLLYSQRTSEAAATTSSNHPVGRSLVASRDAELAASGDDNRQRGELLKLDNTKLCYLEIRTKRQLT